ncbi:MAG TPA: acetyl-CoA C-acyltransferase [Thermomicrobiales bacterium]|nr:acetyl-CoA C-acyltransferase [Thermomicrobiales bacterium]
MVKEAVIVAGARTAVGKAPRGTLRATRPDDMAAAVLDTVVKQVEGKLEPAEIEDVVLGCAIPESEQGFNVARVAALRAGLPDSIPGTTVNRFCSSGLQTIAQSAERIMAGFGTAILAGGTESMSMVPQMAGRLAPNPYLVETHPDVYLGMGLTGENVAKEWHVSREDQDAFALRSHQRAVAAIDGGRFKDEIVPLPVKFTYVDDGGRVRTQETVFDTDEGPRRDTSPEALAKLRPVFAAKGTVTAGNSSQTSDGAAAVLVMEREFAESRGLKPLARFIAFAVGGVRPEVMGIGPVVAVPKVLKLANLNLEDMDLIELNEAFAAQSVAVIRELGMDPEKVNVNGGAIALGHPMGATGAKLTVQILDELRRRGGRYGMVTMCVGGGQGAAGIFELLD